jgi:hypothetical protein
MASLPTLGTRRFTPSAVTVFTLSGWPAMRSRSMFGTGRRKAGQSGQLWGCRVAQGMSSSMTGMAFTTVTGTTEIRGMFGHRVSPSCFVRQWRIPYTGLRMA